LREGLWAVAERLRSDGFKAVAFADDNSMVDREIAYEAGLGWFGKNANLLIAGAGSYFVLGSVVTTAPLPLAPAVVADGCGSCRRCLDGCPTGAIIAPGVVDASRCLAWLLQKPGVFDRRFRAAVGNRLYGCDDCQEVCPPTVRLGAHHTISTNSLVGREAVVDVLDLLDAPDAEVLARWGRWYLADRDPRWLRRNALVILGNSNTAHDARVRATLSRYLAVDDPVLRAHAVWATRSLALDHLLPTHDTDASVMAELTDPL
jgi:epoxyqueuosine reductase